MAFEYIDAAMARLYGGLWCLVSGNIVREVVDLLLGAVYVAKMENMLQRRMREGTVTVINMNDFL